MIDKDTELKRLLNEFDSNHNVSISETERNIDYVAKEIEKLFDLPNIINWVAIEDRKPSSELGNYLVCLKNEAVLQMAYSSITDNWWIIGGSEEQTNNPVVFWAELPKPPCL